MFMTLVTVYNLDNVITQEALMSRMYIIKEAIPEGGDYMLRELMRHRRDPR